MIEDPMKKTACQAEHVTGADRKGVKVSEWKVCWALICALLPISQLAANPHYLYSKGRSEKADLARVSPDQGISNCLAYNAAVGKTGAFAGGRKITAK